MKLFKPFCSIAICVVLICVCAFAGAAYTGDTYSIEIPDGFTEFEVEGQTAAWKNGDATIIINLAVSENTSNVKVNPNDAGQSYITVLEDNMKATVAETGLDGEVVSINSKLIELGEHDAIKVSMATEYTFENGTMTVYQNCYVFETENYIHAFVITSDGDISEFSDNLIKTVKINDEAVARRESGFFSSMGGSVVKGALIGAVIGALVGLVLVIIKKFTNKKNSRASG